MVAGKLLILTASSSVLANPIEEPRFFEYRSGHWTNRLADVTFGWFKTLDREQKIAYNQALTHAVLYAENGQSVRWYKNDASGVVMPSATWPSGAGYCRRIYIQTIAYGVVKNVQANACFNDVDNRWTWYN